MDTKDKELLLKDLCARLPYVTCMRLTFGSNVDDQWIDIGEVSDRVGFLDADDIKSYLRPMSSMTEEELKEYSKVSNSEDAGMWTDLDWLNAHHFDYRGLIEKGLALEATEGMYKTE